MAHTPYNVEFCVSQECPHLEHRGKCNQDKCSYNLKRIKYWEKFGVYPPNG